MAIITCSECRKEVSDKAVACPHCGNPIKSQWRGFEWRSKTEILGLPLIHIAFGRNKQTGKLLLAKGIIAIGQFGIGVITIAQFGIGVLFGFGQFVGGIIAVGQFAGGIYFGLGQFSTGQSAIGQFALGKYALAQIGYGEHIWSNKIKSPEAIEYFGNLWDNIKKISFFQ